MESPVMTSASSHRLRSAVSACAQPTHSYLSSSYLNASFQVESHSSGGCFKKFRNSEKNGEESFLNITRKSHSNSDLSPLQKRHKVGKKNGLHHQKIKKNGKEAENSSNNDVLNFIPKQVMLGNDFFSKLQFNGKLSESKRLGEYFHKTPRNETVNNNCEKVISGKNSKKISVNGTSKKKKKKNNNNNNNNINNNNNSSSTSTGNNNNNNNNNKVLNHRYSNCNKGKGKKNTNTGKKNSIDEGNERCDEWTKCNVLHIDKGIRDERQELSKWQPKHVVTRRTAQIVRDIKNVWNKRVGSCNIPVSSGQVKLLLEDLQLCPSASQVNEMLEYTKERPGEPSTKSANSVTFMHFCRIADDLFKVTKSSSTPRISYKNDEKRSRKISKGMNKYEVFLGGSCNPTTWRTDFAIPELERMAISYYNPQQVEEWRPELMEAEYYAKENASVMFFVLDNQTRGVSALIEVAHLAGNRRELILVIQSYTQKNQIICDEEISKEEYEELKKGQEVLQVLVERQGIPVFNNIKMALECTEKILRENLRVQDLQASVHVNRETLITPRDAFEKLDSENSRKISAGDACLGLKILTGVDVSVSDLEHIYSKIGKKVNGALPADVQFDFELFSELAAEFRKRLKEKANLDPFYLSSSCYKDVYLGGTIENTFWRESIAIPALKKESLSYFVPKINEAGCRFSEIEAAAMDNSYVVLFVITNTARSIAAMAIAGHYIGKDAKVVLCVEHLPENAVIGEEKLSENAIKDYNRGRMYLTDIANRSGVQVLDDISTAVKFVIQKCKSR